MTKTALLLIAHGSRQGEARTYANLMITMLLCGLWHGAAWIFVLFGAYHGALLSLERMTRSFSPSGRASRLSAAASNGQG